MAQLRNKITTNRLLVQLPSYIIKTRATAVSSLEWENKSIYFHFLQKWENTAIFNGPVNLLTPMGLFHFICSVDF